MDNLPQRRAQSSLNFSLSIAYIAFTLGERYSSLFVSTPPKLFLQKTNGLYFFHYLVPIKIPGELSITSDSQVLRDFLLMSMMQGNVGFRLQWITQLSPELILILYFSIRSSRTPLARWRHVTLKFVLIELSQCISTRQCFDIQFSTWIVGEVNAVGYNRLNCSSWQPCCRRHLFE